MMMLRSLFLLLIPLCAWSITPADERLQQAIANPEYMLDHWVELPTSPDVHDRKLHHLSLREAILLALRYNPNIKNAELDRIIQRYQLRLAHNEFELQYALSGAATVENSRFSNVGSTHNSSALAAPTINWKSPYGTQLSMNLQNNVAIYQNYSPVFNVSLTQPLLRGFSRAVNEAALRNAIDAEALNKIFLKQTVSDQITEVVFAYRRLVLSENTLQNQHSQLEEARKTFAVNKKKIKAGQLEPTANVQQSYQIESLSLLVEQAENELKVASQDLLQAIGLDPAMRLAVPNDLTLDKVKIPSLKQAITDAFAHNSQFLAQKMLLCADQRAYDVAKNQQLWELDAGLNAQTGMVNNVDSTGFRSIYNGRNVTEAAQLTLTIPIRDLNRRNELINAKVKLEKDKLDLIALKRALITTVTNLLSNIESQEKRYRLAIRQEKLAAKSYALEKKKQQAGIASSLDVNNTQNQLIQAQSAVISAKIAYLNELSTLQRLLGTTLEEWDVQLRFGT